MNVGYLSQIENDKASPSLAMLASIGEALDVPPAWFLMGESRRRSSCARPSGRSAEELGRVEHVDGSASRDVTIIEAVAHRAVGSALTPTPAMSTMSFSRAVPDEPGRRHVVELGPGDYLRWDGAVPHEGEVIGDEEAAVLIVRIEPRR